MKTSFLLILFALCLQMAAQEKLGITNSNYSPTNSIYLNPSSSVDSKVYMQLNLVGANASFFNNIGYLPWLSVWRMRRHQWEVQYPKLSTSRSNKFLYANAAIEGPAFIISKRNYGAGLFVRARSVANLRGIPYELVNVLVKNNPYEDLPKEGDLNIRNARASNMTWVEYGANFGIMYKRDRNNLITVGGNLKYLTGINMFYANLSRLSGFYNDSVVRVDEMSGKARYVEPGFFSGKGFGMDLGVTYKKMLKSVDNYMTHSKQGGCSTIDYKYRIGVSLRDVGYIKFGSGNKYALNGSGGINATADTTQQQIESSLNLVSTTGKITSSLPTNISVQFDWNFENHLYLNGTIVSNILPQRITSVHAPYLLSVCPRYEFRQFELAMPLTFQRFYHPQLGFAFRVRSFVLGFDNVIPLLFMKPRTYGMGIYFSLGITLFKNPACGINRRRVDDCPPGSTNPTAKKKLNLKFWKKKRR